MDRPAPLGERGSALVAMCMEFFLGIGTGSMPQGAMACPWGMLGIKVSRRKPLRPDGLASGGQWKGREMPSGSANAVLHPF